MSPESAADWLGGLIEHLPAGALIKHEAFRGQNTLMIEAQSLPEVMRLLRDQPELAFRYLIDVTALDFYPQEPRFHVVYHVWSHHHGRLLRVKSPIHGDPPEVPTMTGVWTTANWHERECHDLFGILFKGHPDLRRILLPEDWEDHPLRKDYPVEGR